MTGLESEMARSFPSLNQPSKLKSGLALELKLNVVPEDIACSRVRPTSGW